MRTQALAYSSRLLTHISLWVLLPFLVVDSQEFNAHSTHRAATSAPIRPGISIPEIVRLADWTNETTFKKLFCRFISGACVGSRCMHTVPSKVLVGQYCEGTQTMSVPPPKNCSRPEILFDSVVNQTTFVVFSDNQCYPEYLIKF